MEEGFEPGADRRALYVFDRKRDAYVALDRETYAKIVSGAVRL